DFAPELPESLERVVLKALAFHRDDRFQTARDLQHDLGRFQLEWGHKAGALIDSGALAQQLSQLVPAAQRAATPRPPAEGAPQRAIDKEPSGEADASHPALDPRSGAIAGRPPAD